MTEDELAILHGLSEVPRATIGGGFDDAVERLAELGLIEADGEQWRITAAGTECVAARKGATIH